MVIMLAQTLRGRNLLMATSPFPMSAAFTAPAGTVKSLSLACGFYFLTGKFGAVYWSTPFVPFYSLLPLLLVDGSCFPSTLKAGAGVLLGQHTVPGFSNALADLGLLSPPKKKKKIILHPKLFLAQRTGWVLLSIAEFLRCETAESMDVFLIKEAEKNVHQGAAVRKTRV